MAQTSHPSGAPGEFGPGRHSDSRHSDSSGVLGHADGMHSSEGATEASHDSALPPRNVVSAPAIATPATTLNTLNDATASELGEASNATFLSEGYEPTLVSIQRVLAPPLGIQEQWVLCADHNYDGTRHSLAMTISTDLHGEITLAGRVREIGSVSVLGSSVGRNENSILLSFEFSSGLSQRLAHSIIRQVMEVLEEFSQQGVWGLDQQLHRVAGVLGAQRAQVVRSPRLEEQMAGSIAARRVASYADFTEDEPSDLQNDSEEQREERSSVRFRLIELADISIEQHKLIRGAFNIAGEDDHCEKVGKASDLDSDNWYHPQATLLGRSRWVEFFSPDRASDSSVVFSIRVPRSWESSVKDLSCAQLEIAGPMNRFGLRERYVFHDRANVLTLNELSFNRELFHELFNALHSVNDPDGEALNGVEAVVRVLRDSGLQERPRGVRAFIKAVASRLKS